KSRIYLNLVWCGRGCLLCFLYLLFKYPVIVDLFFFNATAPTEIYTLSLHDALPIWRAAGQVRWGKLGNWHCIRLIEPCEQLARLDRKSTRLNSSHLGISYAVFCLKKKNKYRPHER